MVFFDGYFDEMRERLSDESPATLDRVCAVLTSVRARGKKVIVAGNGGSSAIASHVAVDLTKAAGLRAITFSDSSAITCFANDYGYENALAKAIEFYADAGDVAIVISSSGRSPNVLNAAKCAKSRGLTVVTLSGFEAANPLRAVGDINLWTNSRSYNVVESAHQTWLLACIDRIVAQGAPS